MQAHLVPVVVPTAPEGRSVPSRASHGGSLGAHVHREAGPAGSDGGSRSAYGISIPFLYLTCHSPSPPSPRSMAPYEHSHIAAASPAFRARFLFLFSSFCFSFSASASERGGWMVLDIMDDAQTTRRRLTKRRMWTGFYPFGWDHDRLETALVFSRQLVRKVIDEDVGR